MASRMTNFKKLFSDVGFVNMNGSLSPSYELTFTRGSGLNATQHLFQDFFDST